MKVQVLLSTMKQGNYDIINRIKLNSPAVVVNQTNDEAIKHLYKNHEITWIDSKTKGLSKSRNIALKNATEEICIITDDDIKFEKNYKDLIINQFNENPDFDIIVFQVEGINKKFKNYGKYKKRIGYLNVLKVSSVEIAFKQKKIKEKNITFDNSFGSGAEFFLGEESIFLYDALKANLKILYVPLKIANLYLGQSSWFHGFNEKYLISKGAAFTRMTKRGSIILILQFAIRKNKLLKKENINLKNSVSYMLKGRKEYLLFKNFKN